MKNFILKIIKIFIALLNCLVRLFKRKKRDLNTAANTASSGDNDHIELLKAKIQAASLAMRSSEINIQHHGKNAVYALPWYLFIGPRASGKSQLLQNSGLHYPFEYNQNILKADVKNLETCDWLFADEAILIDVSGRYISESVYYQEWLILLDLLNKHRPRQPLNGIVLVLNITEFINKDEKYLKQQSNLLRERIGDIIARLGFILPVYIVLNQCDLLSGFKQFFMSFTDKQCQQVWGIYIGDARDQASKIQQIKEGFQQLYLKLASQRMAQLVLHSTALDKIAVLEFPQQFLTCCQNLESFLQLFLKTNPYQETPLFAGVYFASAIAPGYFIHDFLKQVVFSTKTTINKSQQKIKILRWLKRLLIIIASSCILTTVVLYMKALETNTALLRRSVATADQLSATLLASDSLLSEKLEVLNQGLSMIDTLANYRNIIPWYQRLGIYPGNNLMPDIKYILMKAIAQLIYMPCVHALEKQLQSYQQNWPQENTLQKQNIRGQYYSMLKAYLMLASPDRMDIALTTNILTQMFSMTYHLPVSVTHDLIYFYLSQPDHIIYQVQQNIIDLSRQQLYLPMNINNLYAGMRALGLYDLGELSIQNIITTPDSHLLIANQLLPKLFTKEGWLSYAKPKIAAIANNAIYGDWVMNAVQNKSPQQVSVFINQLEKLYFADYKQAWCQFLGGIHPQTFYSLNDAAKQLSIIGNNQGPLAHLLYFAYNNFLINNNIADAELSDLRQITKPNNNALINSDINNYLQQLIQIKNSLERLSMSSDIGRDTQNYASQLLAGNGNNTDLYQASVSVNTYITNINDAQTRTAIQSLLLSPLKEVWRMILQQATIGLEQQWQTEVYAPFQQSLANKYPFESNGEDATPSDIAKFFDPQQGILWQFIVRSLMPYLDLSAQGWQVRTWLGIGVNFSPQFLQILSQAKIIADNFFAVSSNPNLIINIYPEPTPGLREIRIDTNNQRYSYRNEPQEWQVLNWPGTVPNDDTVLAVISDIDGSQGNIEINSLWGFFKLLHQAKLTINSDQTITATWQVATENGHHYQVRFLVRIGNNTDLLQLLLNNSFEVPSALFDRKSSS